MGADASSNKKIWSVRLFLLSQHMAWLRSAAHLMVGVMLGCIFFNVGNDAAKVTGNIGFIFFLMLFLFFSNAMPTVLTCNKSQYYGDQLNNFLHLLKSLQKCRWCWGSTWMAGILSKHITWRDQLLTFLSRCVNWFLVSFMNIII